MDTETREWLEAFETRIDGKFDAKLEAFGARIDAKIDFMEGWLRSEFEGVRDDIKGLDVKVDHGFAMVRRGIRDLDRRVSKLEGEPPIAAE